MFHPDMAYQMARDTHQARMAAAERSRQVRQARAAARKDSPSWLGSLLGRRSAPAAPATVAPAVSAAPQRSLIEAAAV
jgi:hypothetical protein